MPNQEHTIDIRCGRLFPFQFQVIAIVFLIGSVATFYLNPVIALLLILISVVILTAHEGTEINSSARTYREYNSFLFIRSGQHKKYSGIEKIFINSEKVSQKMYTPHTLDSSTFRHINYNAWLKFDNGVKVHLMSKKDKEALLGMLGKIAMFLNTSVVDATGETE